MRLHEKKMPLKSVLEMPQCALHARNASDAKRRNQSVGQL